MHAPDLLALARRVVWLEAQGILAAAERFDERFAAAVEILARCRGRVLVHDILRARTVC
jgi:D-arabinose 5-phosphate isomerase GutQ